MRLFLYATSDIIALLAAGFCAVVIRLLYGDAEIVYSFYIKLIYTFPIVLALYYAASLYKTGKFLLHEELKVIFCTTSFYCLLLGTVSFFMRNAEVYSRSILVLFWILATFFVFYFRRKLEGLENIQKYFNIPVVVQNSKVISLLEQSICIDSSAAHFKPVGCFEKNNATELVSWDDCYKYKHLPLISEYPHTQEDISFLEKAKRCFGKIYLASEQLNYYSVRSIEGKAYIEITQKLLDSRRQIIKRIFDLLILAIISPILLPIMLIVGCLVKLDRGTVFYCQKRLGKDGKTFSVIKFRTMHVNADALLQDYLLLRSDLKREWEENHKLKNDPRITTIGKFLRKVSLDELPQVVNVLKGEMSFVGPRPIVENEIAKYGELYDSYKRVLPGLTGLWQVSGRSSTSYSRRINLDAFYIQNWSLWMDIYIFLKTPKALIKTNNSC